jgi:hypothetical protein
MIKILVLAVFLALAGCSGCSNTPKTVAQAQVIGYSQIASAMEDANRLYRLGVIDDAQHKEVYTRLLQAYNLTAQAEEYKNLPDQLAKAKEEVTRIYNEVKEMLE